MTPAPITPDNDVCPRSKRVDGQKHSWHFDGDDPYIVCSFCGEVRDTITGRFIKWA
jgi:hypothetical protein